MDKLHIGDTVRFLNSVGGGKVKGFLNKHLAMVEDEHGFDVPVLIAECVLVSAEGDRKQDPASFVPKEDIVEPQPKPQTITSNYTPEETPDGEEITVCIAYLPTDPKNISMSAYECYLVNDSNYYLFFNYMSRENSTWTSRYNGLIEPNTKMFVEELNKSQLNDIEKTSVQFIAFKQGKPYKFKEPCSMKLNIDTVKFYKLHCFTENDYFEEDALVYYIMKNDVAEYRAMPSANEIKQAMLGKKEAGQSHKISKPARREQQQPAILEIDLHIDQLLDTTAGMDNAEMLEYQLKRFNEVMTENLKNKNRKIVFIHGKGEGVLRNALLAELKKKYKNCSVQDASFREYGFGATMVTIR